jgi:hypothetical protein
MKRHDIFSGMALLVSLSALILSTTLRSKTTSQTESVQLLVDEKIEYSTQAIRSELIEKLDSIITNMDLQEPDHSLASPNKDGLKNVDFKNLVQQAKKDPEVARLLHAGIESIILNEMADELASVDWLDTLSKEKLQALLTKTAKASLTKGFSNFQTPIDVSEIEGIDGKVARILEEFEGISTYHNNNALVKQITEMGDEAIEPLLSHLDSISSGSNWAMRRAITDSLEKLLTEDHEEIIITEFTKSGKLSKLIEKYKFPAAEEEVLNKIMHPLHGRVDNNVVDAALKMNAESSIPLLIDYVSHGQNVSYAASQLAAEGIDITEPLRMASSRAGNDWEKAALVELCLERDMPEGYDLAIQVLRSNGMHAEHSKEKVYQYIRKYSGINGSFEDAANWLQENRTY